MANKKNSIKYAETFFETPQVLKNDAESTQKAEKIFLSKVKGT